MHTFNYADPELKRYMADVARHPILTREEELKCAKQAKHGNKALQATAREKLIVSNLRFVVQQANKFRPYTNGGKFTIMDLIQEGNSGLVYAFNKYDYRKGYRFTTYAVHWIRARIMSHLINNYSVVKIGTTGAERQLFFKMREVKALLEIMDSDKRAEGRQQLADKLKLPVAKIEYMEKRLSWLDSSNDKEIHTGEGTPLTVGDLLTTGETIEEDAAETDQHDKMIELIQMTLANLNAREKDIIRLRWLQEDGLTLQAIANKYGVSRERIRQIETLVFKKMKRYMKDNPTTREILENL